MDPTALATKITIWIASYLAEGGEKPTERTGNRVLDAGDELWNVIMTRLQGKPVAEGIAKELMVNPSDDDNQEAFIIQIRKVLRDDQAFADQLANLLEISQANKQGGLLDISEPVRIRNEKDINTTDSRPLASDTDRIGRVKWFDTARGFGYIMRQEGEDILFRFLAIQDTNYLNLEEGQKVGFTINGLLWGLVAFASSNRDVPRKAVFMDLIEFASNVTTFVASSLTKAARKLSDNFLGAGDELWNVIMTRFQGKPAAESVAKELTLKPEDEDNQESFNIQLRKVLKDDLAFAAQLANLLVIAQSNREAGVTNQSADKTGNNLVNTGSGAIANGQGVAAGEGGVAVGGNVLGDVLINALKIVIENRDNQHEAKLALGEYLGYIIGECGYLTQFITGPINRNLLELIDVYIPIQLDKRVPANMRLEEYLSLLEGGQPDRELAFDQEKSRPIHALEALNHHKDMVLLGKPGSGKSTFVSFIALMLARAGQGDMMALTELGEDWRFGPLLPVRITVRRFAEYLADKKSDGNAADVWDFIEVTFKESGLLPATAAVVQKIARMRGALFLFDGLDEVSQENLGPKVLNAVNMFKQTAGRNSRFLITARPYAWNAPSPLKGEYRIADLETAQIETYVDRWCQAIANLGWRTAAEAFKIQNELKKAVKRTDLNSIVQVPLLLNMIASVHTSGGHFPGDRADLYNTIVEFMIEKWNRAGTSDSTLLDELQVPGLTLRHLRETLQRIAFDTHQAGLKQASTADISEETLKRAFRKILGDSDDKARIVINYIEQRAGLLIGLGSHDFDEPRQYAFSHRTLQEYMAACHLAGYAKFGAEVATLATQSPDYWHEVLVMAARIVGEERGVAVAHRLVDHTDPEERLSRRAIEPSDFHRALLAGEQLMEIGFHKVKQDEANYKVCADVAKWLAIGIMRGEFPTERLVRAGDLLAYLGDTRFRTKFWYLPDEPLLGFVEIPAGSFLMGSDVSKDDRAKSDELPQHEVSLSRFLIARYPTTVSQFQAFVQASGYKPGDEKSLSGLPNHPVRYVNWHEALAYCEWLTETIKNSPSVPPLLLDLLRNEGWQVTLPSEAETEMAARSNDGRIYPWGDNFDETKTNTAETGIANTSAVGCFSKGASLFGLLDTCGNVWEWTRSLWGEDPKAAKVSYPYHPGTDRENLQASPDILRVMRGGSYNDGRWNARCACRFRNVPGFRFHSVGFRVALTSISSE
jgi:formylglycine-generating enzyme required for sulfatase activity/cold shock CspA family protein